MNKDKIITRLGQLLGVSLLLTIIFFANQNITAQEIVLPETPPDAEIGLAIYSERCSICHGVTANGDGESAIAAGLTPAVFADPNYRLEANPQNMFDVISNGSLTNGMPPFGAGSSNPLAPEHRWNMIAAAYSFSTPPESITLGEEIAAEQSDLEFPEEAYWFTHSNAEAITDLIDGTFGFDGSTLSEEEQMAVVDYGRSLTYNYIDPFAPPEPIEFGVISGQVVNGSTLEPLSDGTVSLRAFTFDLDEALALETEIDEDGRFEFEVTDVNPDWVYLTTVEYEDLAFNSEANQLQRENPVLEMPIIVYNTTTDPSDLNIAQLHLILNFEQDVLQVSEFYVFNNDGTAVFTGESGNPAEGTTQLFLPAGAENVSFQRAFGGFDSFIPANEIIQTETGWADTVPVRPGETTSNLLVSYDLPYEDGLRLAHPVAYNINVASATMPDIGVELVGDGWQQQGVQETPGGMILSFANSNINGADSLNVTFDGEPQLVFDTQGNALLVRDTNQELIIGTVVLLLTFAIAAFFLYKWRQPVDQVVNIEDLLYHIADLDDAFAAGEIEESQYLHQREQLKGDLATIWRT